MERLCPSRLCLGDHSSPRPGHDRDRDIALRASEASGVGHRRISASYRHDVGRDHDHPHVAWVGVRGRRHNVAEAEHGHCHRTVLEGVRGRRIAHHLAARHIVSAGIVGVVKPRAAPSSRSRSLVGQMV